VRSVSLITTTSALASPRASPPAVTLVERNLRRLAEAVSAASSRGP